MLERNTAEKKMKRYIQNREKQIGGGVMAAKPPIQIHVFVHYHSVKMETK